MPLEHSQVDRGTVEVEVQCSSASQAKVRESCGCQHEDGKEEDVFGFTDDYRQYSLHLGRNLCCIQLGYYLTLGLFHLISCWNISLQKGCSVQKAFLPSKLQALSYLRGLPEEGCSISGSQFRIIRA